MLSPSCHVSSEGYSVYVEKIYTKTDLIFGNIYGPYISNLNERIFNERQTYELQSIGAAFGDVLASERPLRWVMVTDEFGTDPTLRFKDSTVQINALTMISKRIEKDQAVNLSELFRLTSDQLMRVGGEARCKVRLNNEDCHQSSCQGLRTGLSEFGSGALEDVPAVFVFKVRQRAGDAGNNCTHAIPNGFIECRIQVHLPPIKVGILRYYPTLRASTHRNK